MKKNLLSAQLLIGKLMVLILSLASPALLAQVTWQVQSDYFGERNAIAQPRTIRGMALSADGQSVYTGLIQSPNTGSTSLRKVKSSILAIPGTDHVIFGNGMPGGTGTFGQVGGQPVYADQNGAPSAFEGWIDVGNSPEGIDADDRGYVYVALQSGISNASRVDIFNANLTAQVGTINVASPTGVHIHKSGGIYYAYTVSASGLQRWNVTAVNAPVLDAGYNPGVFGPRNLTVDADGTVYAVGVDVNQVVRVSPAGVVTHTTTILNAADVAVFGNKLYIIKRESPSKPVVVLNKADLTSAGPDLIIPDFGIPRGTISQFTSIDVSADGRLYVSEENYQGTANGIPSYTPPPTSFNPVPGVITGRIYHDRVIVSSPVEPDSDGDGVIDVYDNCPTTSNPNQDDLDNDGIGDACDNDIDGDGVLNANDCAPHDANIGAGQTWYADADGDGYGNPAVSQQACSQPVGYVDNSDDCDDNDASANPASIWFRDADGDGFGNPASSVMSCMQPAGYVDNNWDCDDAKKAGNPADEKVIMCRPTDNKQECFRWKDVQKKMNEGFVLGPCTSPCGTEYTLMCYKGKMKCAKNKDVQKNLGKGWTLGACPTLNFSRPTTIVQSVEVTAKDDAVIYPSPTSGRFAVKLSTPAAKAEIIVTNSNGAIVLRRTVNGNTSGQTETFDLGKNGPGMYFIRIVTAEGVQTSKIIVQR